MKTTVIGLLSDEFYGHHWKTAVGVALFHTATPSDTRDEKALKLL